MGAALDSSLEEFLCENFQGLGLAVLRLVLLVLGGVADLVAAHGHTFFEVEHAEVTRERVAYNDLVFEEGVDFGFGFGKGLGLVHMVWGDT